MIIHRFSGVAALLAVTLVAWAQPARGITAPPGFVVDSPFPGVTFNQPLQILFAPDGRRFVAEKGGTVSIVSAAGVKLATPYIDLTSHVISTGDRGLISIALDPDFSSNGWVYLLYSADPDSNGVGSENACFGRVERYKALPGDPDQADLASRQVLIGTGFADGIPLPGSQRGHIVGTLRFGRDGSLLVGCGDAANYGTADAGGLYPGSFGPGLISPTEDIGAFRSQSINSMAGKILRVDKDTGHGFPSNPFWNGDPVATRSRVWLYGLRNPFRYSVKPGSGSTNPADGAPGTLFVADVGWFTTEELDVCTRGGLNLGWPCVEGPATQSQYQLVAQPPGVGCTSYGSSSNPVAPSGPSAWWSHTSPSSSSPTGTTAASVVAGAFYTGAGYPALYRNSLFVADFVEGWIWTLELNINDQVVGGAPFITSGADTPVDLEIDPVTGDVWYVSIASGVIRRIRFATGNRDPLAHATVTPNYGPAPLLTTFDASGTMDADSDPLAFRWLFGDGASDTASVTTHVYNANGVYPVSLSVRDGLGGLDSLSFTVVVGSSPPPGEIVLPGPNEFRSTGDVLSLQAALVDESAGPVTYRWDVDLLHFAHTTHVHDSQSIQWGPTAEFVWESSGNLEPTAYRVRLSVTQGALTTSDTVVVHPLQDIAAGPLRPSYPSPHVNRTLPVTATLRAGGGIGEFETTWKLMDGSQTVASGYQPPLAPGDSSVFTIPVSGLSAGPHVLTLVADADAKRTEIDESNNTSTLALYVRGPGEPFATWCADSAAGPGPLPPTSPGPWNEGVNELNGTLEGYASGETRWHGSGTPGDPVDLSLDGVTEHVRLAPAGGASSLQAPILSASAEIWFQPGSDVTRAQQLIHWADGLTAPRTGLSLALAGGRLLVDARPVRDVGGVSPHAWTHVIVSAGQESLRVYVNGRRSFTDTYSNLGLQLTDLLLGAASAIGSGAAESHFGGHVGEVRLYEDELSDAQAAACYSTRALYYLGAPPVHERVLAAIADSAVAGAPAPVPGAASPWEDRTGHGHNLSLQDFEPVSDTSGWSGGSSDDSPPRLEFDGVDDMATLVPDELGELAGDEPLTITLWLRTGLDVQRTQRLVEWRESASPGAAGLVLSLGAGSFRFGEGGAQVITPAAPERWYHLVVSTAPDQAAAWLDGVPVWTANTPAGGAQHTALTLGGPAVGPSPDFFRGSVARFEIWRGRFTDADVDSIRDAQSGPFLHRFEFGLPSPAWLSLAQPCLNVPFRFERTQGPELRGVSVTVRVPAGLTLCGPALAGSAFDGVTTQLFEFDPGPGLHTVDLISLGASCVPGSEELFTLPVAGTTPSGSSTFEIVSVIARDCSNHPLSVDIGAPLELRVDTAAPAAPGAVAASPELNSTGPDGRYPLRLSFAVAADVERVEVYRAPFGNAPEYDDAPGAGQAPAPPASYPPGAPWQRTSVAFAGRTDTPAVHDAWTYVAYAFDAAGNRSALSPSGNERVNYRLGDVRAALADCASDGLVGAADVAGLSAAYGATLVPGDPRACLDSGPTVDGSLAARPLTDNILDFEDMMMLALDYDAIATGSAPLSNTDAITIAYTPSAAVGDTIDVDVLITGSGRVHGLSARIEYDAARLAPAGVKRGARLAANPLGSIVLTPEEGVLDLALLGKGPGIGGSGQLASVRFRRIATGGVVFAIADAHARDALNHALPLVLNQPVGGAPPARMDRVALSPGAPDPFRQRIEFTLSLPRAGPVRLGAFDVAGRLVRTLADGPWPAGEHRIVWDGSDDHGATLAPGIYFVSLEAERSRTTRRVVRLR